MAIKDNKERIIITLPKEQIKWLETMAKKSGKTKSKFISIFLARKADELYNFLRFEETKPTEEELNQILEIIKTKWIED